jgi:polyisoprenoid-binding protein YceI
MAIERQERREHREMERWEIDGQASRLDFSLRHIVVSEIQGRFRSWGGEMLFDPEDPSRTEIRVWIDIASIETGSLERDTHLRSAEFLDVDRFPRAEFVSTYIVARADGEAALLGRLQLHGIARAVGLEVVAERRWIDDGGVMRAAYRVHGKVDRQAFGLHWNQDLDVGGIVVGDRVDIEAYVEVVRGAEAVRPDRRPRLEPAAPAR